jgi:hypothetical protein
VTVEDVCYQVTIGANVLQILAQEVFHVDDVSDQLDASLRDQLKLLASKEKQDKWFGDIATHHYDRKLFGTNSPHAHLGVYKNTVDRQLLTSCQ